MTKVVVIEKFGGPEVLQWREESVPAPGSVEVLVRHTAVGLNFIDVYQRTGLYPLELPAHLGLEAAGEVLAVGQGVAYVSPGDRVACTSPPPGAYAEERIYQVDKLVKLPAGITDQTAAAAMLKGLTAWYLLHRSYAVKPGDNILLYAAAGGVGLLLVQMVKQRGGWVAGTVSTDEKAQLARQAGADEVILYTQTDFEVCAF